MAESDQNKKYGLIFDIQRFSVHDGPGIRTLLFFKGCPLRCQWCSNPEGRVREQQILYNSRRCIACNGCVAVCHTGASSMINGTMVYDRKKCIVCGKCIEVCPSGARTLSGKWITVDEVMDVIEKDRVFFRHSGGGITLGGGEPTYQPEFAEALLTECRRNNIHTAIETCGYADWKIFSLLLEKTDLVLFDIKHIDDSKQRHYTGASNRIILDNLDKLLMTNKKIVVRITLIPHFNDSKEEKEKIVDFIKSKRRNVEIEYLFYHKYGLYKYELLGERYPYRY